MKGKRRLGLVVKFNILTIALIISTSIGIAGFVILQEMDEHYKELLRNGFAIASIAAENSEYAIYTKSPEAMEQVIDGIKRDSNVVYAAIMDKEKVILADAKFKTGFEPISQPYGAGSGKDTEYREITNSGDGIRYIEINTSVSSVSRAAQGLFQDPSINKTIIGYVRLVLTTENLNNRIRGFLISTILFTVFIVFVGIAFTIIMTTRIASPIKELVIATQDIAEGNFEHQAEFKSNDEVNELALAFNSMIGRLRDYRDRVQQYQKELEEALEEKSILAKKATDASIAKSQFLANMSHEIRTPMNGVLGMAELLMATELTEKQHTFAETIVQSGETLLRVLNDILDFSKIEAGKLELANSEFELTALVEEVTHLFAQRAYGKGLELLCQTKGSGPIYLLGDPGRLRQILANLLGNAVKFTEKGEIVVRADILKEQDGSVLVEFEVRDTGIGIPYPVQAHIFDAFSQADGGITRKYGGTGLGLAICKQLCEMMGGKISLESAPGRGSSFRFTAVLKRSPVETDLVSEFHPSLQSIRVLIVDDNETNRSIMHHQVLAWGMRNGCAADGPTALEMLRQASERGEPYDLAILDMIMPGMSGLELAGIIKSDPSIEQVRLILLTSFSEQGDIRSANALGISAYLSKPVSQRQFFDCLVKTLGKPRDAEVFKTQEAVNLIKSERESLRGRILLVEDNAVNQEVARSMLEYLGCTVDSAGNGFEGVDAFSRNSYDLILMDCQMPEMDGFTATRMIRQREAEAISASGDGRAKRIPIISLTAYAMEGDREKCLAAGMDDHLTKPYGMGQLMTVLKRWLPAALPCEQKGCVDREQEQMSLSTPDTGGQETRETSGGSDSAPPVDRKILDSLWGPDLLGMEGVQFKIIDAYCRETPRLLERLRAACDNDDHDSAKNVAHSLKSSSAQMGASHLATLLAKTESLAAEHSMDRVKELLPEVLKEFDRVKEALLADF